ncbi:unnamed protein product [Notodromas monacha]|uniref:PRELI/MSF1 domain-containing protein n=1 Tax=Notodromas monacha TaxID=399045 RepID=A0A7R9BRM8_9CRUS|nr:unnamed protein product [Notodromas monacha]CAG0920416.1 unnamed protein product [Notodromas monacha]
MVKFCAGSFLFPYTWDVVARGLWVRYPNSQSTHVLSEDTLERYVENGKLFTRRLLVKTNPAPKWADRFISKRFVNIVEESIVDPEAQTVVTYTRNIGFTHVMNVVERVVYRKTDPAKLGEEDGFTIAERSAWLSSGVRGFAFAIEKFSLERFKHNTKKANAGLAESIQRMLGVHPVSKIESASSGEKLRVAAAAKAKELKELARSKAEPVYAACRHREDAV